MNHHNTPAQLSDALERAYMQATLTNTEPVSITRGITKAGKGIGRFGARIVRSIGRHMAALNDARARDVRYTHSQW
ncbi:hypothetical protein KVP09_06300 [Alcaligenaceae bacterium CGII-47]|nr:hypothetical protein [Alcaligenaceae bacterium CGII-47]